MEIKLTPENIEDHVEKIGVTVAPAIEHKMEKSHFLALYNDFQIRKKFIFPAKGEADCITLAVPPIGPVFNFPRKVGMMEAETDLGDSEPIIMACIKIFKKHFPLKKLLRVGQVNEYIFTLGTEQTGVDFISKRFTKISMPPDGEIKLRVNRPNDDHNRIIELSPIIKKQVSTSDQTSEIKAYGLKAKVDFNNRDMSVELDGDKIRSIIQASKTFNETYLYEFLNGNLGGS